MMNKKTCFTACFVLAAVFADAARPPKLRAGTRLGGDLNASGFSITNVVDVVGTNGVSLLGSGSDTNLAVRVVAVESGTNNWNTAYGWGDHASGGYLTSYTETDPAWNSGTGVIYAAIGALESNTNDWNTAFGWGDHAAGGYLTSYAETDPLWGAASGAVYTAIALKQDAATAATDSELITASNTLAAATALKFDTANTNAFATAAQGVLADGAVQSTVLNVMVDGNDIIFTNTLGGGYGFTGTGDLTGLTVKGQITATSNIVSIVDSVKTGSFFDDYYVYPISVNDSRYVQPQVAADYLTLDREIESWEDIGITFSNAVILNSPVTITNDSSWTGWTTDGTLQGDDTIFLTIGQYLESPAQSDGISYVDADVWSDLNATSSSSGIYTNGVLAVYVAPWRSAGAKWRVEAGTSLPGGTPSVHVDSVVITGYADLSEAANHKDVSNLGVMDDPVSPNDVANLRFVAAQRDYATAYTDSELTDYAADPDKTVRGSQLRLGNMWVVSPADSTGDRFIMSGGEISGDGQLVGTTNALIFAKNGYPLLEFTSDASGLYVTNFTLSSTSSNVTVNLGIATNGVTSSPFAEWTEDLIIGEWERVATYTTETYPTQSGGTYTLGFTVATTNDTFFIRAMQAEGAAVATFQADVWDFGDAYFILRDSNANRWKVTVSTSGVLTTTDLDP